MIDCLEPNNGSGNFVFFLQTPLNVRPKLTLSTRYLGS